VGKGCTPSLSTSDAGRPRPSRLPQVKSMPNSKTRGDTFGAWCGARFAPLANRVTCLPRVGSVSSTVRTATAAWAVVVAVSQRRSSVCVAGPSLDAVTLCGLVRRVRTGAGPASEGVP
jgi:hypothetical protein